MALLRAPSEDRHIGQRLSFDGNSCTIRYVGTVAGTKGSWLGVEWDDPLRGKHSGHYNGVTYFECKSKHPTAGSFVRPSRPVDKAIGIIEAIERKYGFGTSAENRSAIHISGKQIEEVGFEKVRRQFANLIALRNVIIDGACIATSDNIGQVCPNIQELDLSRNLFEDVDTIWSITEQLPALKTLKIDGNRFCATGLVKHVLRDDPCNKLASLSLDDTLLIWKEIAAVAIQCPVLSTLSASNNQLRTLSDGELPQSIIELCLEMNNLESMNDLNHVFRLPVLRKLSVKGNKISSIDIDPTQQMPAEPTVEILDISYNEISDWRSIDKLGEAFPSMTSLRVSYNPLYKGPTTEDDYLETIARLPRISVLNHSQIKAKDRQTAETFYLSKIAQELALVLAHEEEHILGRHPQYKQLCQKYGEPVIKRESLKSVRPGCLAETLIHCKFRLDESVPLGTKASSRSVERDVPSSLTVYNILGMVRQIFDVKQPGLLQVASLDKVLKPETRPLATLLDDANATLDIRWNSERLKQCTQYRSAIGTG